MQNLQITEIKPHSHLLQLNLDEAKIVSSRVSHGEFAEVIDHLTHGRLHPGVLISKTMHGSQAQEAFELLETHPEENIKVMLNFTG